jgi:4a-hydroxytetrahydrobiopterin dehydratase
VSRLDGAGIAQALGQTPGWEHVGSEIRRTYRFKDFREALAFVNRVGDLAERAGHHPDIDIRYNAVTLALTTHDAGGLSAKDFDLARMIDAR